MDENRKTHEGSMGREAGRTGETHRREAGKSGETHRRTDEQSKMGKTSEDYSNENK